jgi:Toprim-like
MKQLIEQLGLKPKGGNVFDNDDHRLSINGELWNCHKCGKGGAGSIALVMHVLDLGFMDAKKWLGDDVSIPMPVSKPTTTPTTPPSSDRKTLPVVIEYLCINRGLNRVMVQWCVSKGIIYSDYKANACFRYGAGVAMRGTGSVGFRANRGVLTECFTLPARGACEGVAILESAIDALSYRQLHPTITACAIAGNGNGVLMRYALDMALRLEVPVFSAFDGDKGGNDGNDRLLKLNDGVNTIIQHRPPQPLKDWNDCILRLSEEKKSLTAI